MIEAKKDVIFDKLFSIFHKRLMSFSFDKVYWQNTGIQPASPAIFVCNHSSWWDGLIYYQLTKSVIQQDLHIMMHEQGLKQFPYFKKLGAFSINSSSPKETLKTMKYAEKLLKNGSSIWIFPQGDEFHLEKRPLHFQQGPLYLQEKLPEIPLIPVAFYYSFSHKRKPEVWISAGSPLYSKDLPGSSRREKTASLEKTCTNLLDVLKTEVISENTKNFINLL
ncbi:lysophospholipid acyltransferase family protein [Cytobacillus firmus]|uniref:1-acyl-sn-glycerol-3-phosphate acyltransferase n=1 Tax=Cytobacillus firmus DS1 TaxID=1307436 RepID=W7KXU1_CYTFI|nr:lysophospholipid acyltransferase family protein [Cytobacillus firmus]EWG10948.1 1-acyl-sn-glycerol-3-phosphate acyltransferase [Cytobacillus firmus DS1]